MSKYYFILISSSLISFNCLIAQEDSSKSRQLDQVVVTATKYPVKLSETGKKLIVIGREQIEKSAGKDLSQLLSEQTGILVNGAYSNPGKDKALYLLGASNANSLILLDGIPVTDPSGLGGAIDLRLIPLDQIERIEILEGSQSTLYGSDAVAGVINIISKNPGDKIIEFRGGLSYGTYNSLSANAGISGKAKFLDYNVGYSYASSDGISEAKDTTGSANYDKDGFTRQSLQAMLNFHAGEKITLSPFYRYTYYKGDFDDGAFVDGNDKFDYLLNNPGFIATIQLPHGTIHANYGYTFAERNYHYSFGDLNYKGRFNNGEIYLDQRLSEHFKLLAGVNYQSYQLLDTTLSPKNPSTNIFSPYASLFIGTGAGLNIEIGGRLNIHSRYGNNFTYSINTSYLIQRKTKVFFDFSTGFKVPTVTQLFGSFGANPDLKPETSINLLGGIQWNSEDRKFLASASGFIRNVNNLINYVNTMYVNIDEQKDGGAELELSYSPINSLSVKASYAYVTGMYHNKQNGKDSAYYNLLRRPKKTLNFSIAYQPCHQFYVSLSLQSLGKRNDIYFESVPPYDELPVELKAYTMLNAYAEYKFMHDKLAFFLDGKNITNTTFTEVYGYNAIGATITGGLRLNL
ncbi:MAG: TonB-dependent receptor plug domain-containing protein [Chitinophagales bacterium]